MSIYNEKTYALNRFKAYMIPSARALWQKYGPSLVTHRPTGHPDNTDPNHFNMPANPSGVIPNTGGLALGSRAVDLNAEILRANAAAEDEHRTDEDGAPASEEASSADEG